jgi:RNA polymerase sigma-70 factor (ECF subfamily)
VDNVQELKLISKVQAGDKQAFRELYENYYSRIYSMALSIMKSPEEAEEVVQESFVKAYLGIKNFKGESSFYTWLYRITRNMAIDVKRRLARRVLPSLEEPEFDRISSEDGILNSVTVSADQQLETKQSLGVLGRALAKLSEEHRSVLLMREVEGFSYDEISRISGLNNGTVMSRLFYARKALQKALLEAGEVV